MMEKEKFPKISICDDPKHETLFWLPNKIKTTHKEL